MILEGDNFKERYLKELKIRWLSCSDQFPEFLPPIPADTRERNNILFKEAAEKLKPYINSFPRLSHRRRKWKAGLLSVINELLSSRELLASLKGISDEALRALCDELMEFVRQERRFSPELTLDEIGQAMRNYIVYVMFKLMHEDASPFSMAAFGYSMLYPFTDNYIDSIAHRPDEKSRYNRLIRDKICGRLVYPATRHQKKTCELLSAIEMEYPRSSHREIYELLLMMLDAQELSLRQQDRTISLSEEERLDISLYKGGLSVFIDRCLVRKPLSDEEILVYLGIGFFLQLADDLQDIGDDSKQGYQTLFTLNTDTMANAAIVNKLLNFVHDLLAPFKPENEEVKDFVLENCYQLIFASVIGSSDFFPDDYIERIKKLLMLETDGMQHLRDILYKPIDKRSNKKYLKMLDAVIS